ncbi:MAG TPA: transketolase [Candidatus Acidoferrales bacterium]|nr:transketolase [Candidatus Acidoferrales bacterium]
MNAGEQREFEKLAKKARRLTVEMIAAFGVGHVGGALSIIEVLVYLYYRGMRINPENPTWANRDRLVLSKGHSGPGLYSVLAMKGYFELEELSTLNRPGTKLPSHCDMNKTRGVDMTAGSLGQGISAAVGMALAAKIDHKDFRVYCIIGDGEAQEGQVWEATMMAAQHRLDNLTVLLDDNGLQLDGYTDQINSIRPVTARWGGFNWEVVSVDGHNFSELDKAITYAKTVKGRPVLIHMVTSKGKGISIAEAKPYCHNMSITPSDLNQCLKELR